MRVGCQGLLFPTLAFCVPLTILRWWWALGKGALLMDWEKVQGRGQ